jgi:hypothetical protein
MLRLAFAVCLGIALFYAARFVFRVAFIWFVNLGTSSMSKAECIYYPWQERLRPDDPKYISHDTYWKLV